MYRLFKNFLLIFGPNMKGKLSLLMLGAVISGLLELVGILLILPFMMVATNPDRVLNSEKLKYVYDFLGLSDPHFMVYVLALSTGGAFVFKNLYMLLYQRWQFTFIRNWKNDISDDLMRRYIDLSYMRHLRKQSSSIVNTLTSAVGFVLNSFVFEFLSMVSYIIVGICLCLLLFVKFFIPALVSLAILSVMAAFQAHVIKSVAAEIGKDFIKLRGDNLSVLKQSIESIKETKMLMREDFYHQYFVRTNRLVTESDRKLNFIRQVPKFLTEIVLILGILTMICLVIYTGKGERDVLAHLGLLIAVAFRLAPVLNRTLTSYSQVKASTQATENLIEEYKELVQYEDENTYKPDADAVPEVTFKKALELKNIGFSYNDKKKVLHNVSLSIQAGEFIGIVGASGAGKTTLVDILMGLLLPQDGAYMIDGNLVDKETMYSLRKQIGYVHQSIFISNSSIRSNIALGIDENDIDDERVAEVLALVQLYDYFMEKETQLDTLLGENGKNLSGGQRQRVAIARALYNNPSILVLDEATSALDVETEHSITSAISALKGKKTIIAIAHRLSTLKQSDRVVLMDHGKVVDIGSFKDLSKYNAQFKRLIKLSDVKSDF